jgi:para-nitrobenzyl esterase
LNKQLDVYARKERKLMNTVETDTGYISGMVIGKPGEEVRIFKGIPYAAPPVGDLRWKPPQPAVVWSGVKECTVFSPTAPQSVASLPAGRPSTRPVPVPLLEIPQSEDCLYLNILTPAKKATDKLPVMVWMHGGGFIFGSANELLCNLPRLPQHGVVLVNVNMRLGPIGLLAHRLLSRESPEGVSGNYLFLDMIAALKWVQRNITAFGGDPNKVTIFGESGGGSKVISLMASPLVKGLFHRAIAESGSPEGKPLKELERMGDRFFARLGVDKEADPLKAARALPWQKIIAAEKAITDELHIVGPGGLWDVAVDGWFIPDKPLDVFKAGKQYSVPYILAANLGELPTELGAYLIPAYLGLFTGAAKAGVKAHALIFDQVPSRWRREGCVSTHAMELGYVFGDWDNQSGFWEMLFGLAGFAGATSSDPGLTDADRKVSEAMMRMWAQYAKNGNPSVRGLVTWPAYEAATDQYLYIAESLEVKSGYSKLVQ